MNDITSQTSDYTGCYTDMNDRDVKITLVSVDEVEGATAINRRAALRAKGKDVNVDMNVRMIPDLERSIISLVVMASYIHTGVVLRERLLSCSVIATFEIADMEQHVTVKGEDVSVAGRLMMTMLGIAVGALRGIIAVRTAGTPLQHRPLPVIDLGALMYRLRYGAAPVFPAL